MAEHVPTTPEVRPRAATPMPLPIPPAPLPRPFPLPEPPDDERAPSCWVIAFPPSGFEAAAVADAVELLPASGLLPFARNSLLLAAQRGDEPACATANLHATFGAMLALCRALDAAGYPWDCAGRART